MLRLTLRANFKIVSLSHSAAIIPARAVKFFAFKHQKKKKINELAKSLPKILQVKYFLFKRGNKKTILNFTLQQQR